ncbi:MAG: hypothetical protein Q7R45_06985 [Sulfuricaulis sp.]|nr:hypothetical protein [Sulfuricaulis sp.]
MRTTLDIEDDVLFAAKDLARREKKSTGQIISELARKGLSGAATESAREPKAVYGFRPFPKEGRIVSNELINKLREDGEY